VIRRSKHVGSPRKVCFPGGTVELGESQESAVVREMWEELRAKVTPLRAVWRHDFSDKPLTLFGWVAKLDSPGIEPQAEEIEEVFWLTPEEAWRHGDALPTVKDFVDRLCHDEQADGRTAS
jgi:8-oxo-dGTP pyrophosphatase MutT (NUDIX family)